MRSRGQIEGGAGGRAAIAAETRSAGAGDGSDHAGQGVYASNAVALELRDKQVSRAIQGNAHRMTDGRRGGRPAIAAGGRSAVAGDQGQEAGDGVDANDTIVPTVGDE